MNGSSDYLTEYNELLSSVAERLGRRFAALASPTLSKQETVTCLYRRINDRQGRSFALRFPWRRLLEFPPRLLIALIRCVHASVKFRVRKLPRSAVYFRTWLVPRSVESEEVKDDYFRELPNDLQARDATVVGFTSSDFALANRFSHLRRSDNQIISGGLLRLRDIAALAIDYVFTGLVFTRGSCLLGGRDVRHEINRSLLLDYLELRSFEAYLEKYKCRRLRQFKIKAFIYVFENQSWEKVCCRVLGSDGITRIGYQSSGFSKVFLNFYPTAADSLRDPMPDAVLTTGEAFAEHLTTSGRFAVPVVPFAALRIDNAREHIALCVPAPVATILGRILYAFPVHLDQYDGIVQDLSTAFAGSAIQVDLKLHPLYRLEQLTAAHALPANFSICGDIRMDDLRSRYDCVLFNDNTFGIEAMLAGVKSFQYHRDGADDDDRLLGFTLWRSRLRRDDLSRLRHELETEVFDKTFDPDDVARYVRRLYRPYGPAARKVVDELLSGPRSNTAA